MFKLEENSSSNIKEEIQNPYPRNNLTNIPNNQNLNRTVYGNYNPKQNLESNFSKSSNSNTNHSNNSG
jgi:hypothetical protein